MFTSAMRVYCTDFKESNCVSHFVLLNARANFLVFASNKRTSDGELYLRFLFY